LGLRSCDEETTVVLSRIQGSKGLPGAGKGVHAGIRSLEVQSF
jgi:hypothetical protein